MNTRPPTPVGVAVAPHIDGAWSWSVHTLHQRWRGSAQRPRVDKLAPLIQSQIQDRLHEPWTVAAPTPLALATPGQGPDHTRAEQLAAAAARDLVSGHLRSLDVRLLPAHERPVPGPTAHTAWTWSVHAVADEDGTDWAWVSGAGWYATGTAEPGASTSQAAYTAIDHAACTSPLGGRVRILCDDYPAVDEAATLLSHARRAHTDTWPAPAPGVEVEFVEADSTQAHNAAMTLVEEMADHTPHPALEPDPQTGQEHKTPTDHEPPAPLAHSSPTPPPAHPQPEPQAEQEGQLTLIDPHQAHRIRLRPEQAEAVRAIHAAWKSHGRARLLWPCGYGKTVAYAGAAHQWGASLSVVMVSSLDLIPQIRDAFTGVWGPGLAQVLAVCSRREQLAGPAHIPTHLEVISDPQVLAYAIGKRAPTVVVATYHSLDVLLRASTEHGVDFDVLICDEAHHTVGEADARWVRVHHDLPARVRLYGTATPRHLSAADGRQLYSMDDEATFGPLAHQKTFGQGIAEGRLADYQVLATLVGHEQVYAALRGRDRVSVRGQDMGVDLVAAQIATLRAITDHDLRSIICYVPTLEWAARFSDSLSLVHTLGHEDLAGPRPVRALHINGSSTQAERERARRALARPGRSTTVVTVVGCYIEGVDVPAVDAVGLFSGTRSRSRLLQQVGRALRKGEDPDKTAKLLTPLYVPPGAEPEVLQDEPSYERLLAVLHGLRSVDERLGAALAVHRESLTASLAGGTVNFGLTERTAITLPPTWVESISTQVIDDAAPGRLWWDTYRRCADFHAQHGHVRVPESLTTATGRPLNQWVHGQNRAMREDLLPSDRRSALEQIGVDGRRPVERTLHALPPLVEQWLAEHEHLDPPPGHPLHHLLDKVRAAHRKDMVPGPWLSWLQERGFALDPRHEGRMRRIRELAGFAAERGRMPDAKVPSEAPLAAVLYALRRAYRLGQLPAEQVRLCQQHALPLTGTASTIPPRRATDADGTEHLAAKASIDDLVKALEQGANTAEIARACGITPQTVSQRLRGAGLSRKQIWEGALSQRARRAATDEQIEEVARRYQLKPSTVRRFRK